MNFMCSAHIGSQYHDTRYRKLRILGRSVTWSSKTLRLFHKECVQYVQSVQHLLSYSSKYEIQAHNKCKNHIQTRRSVHVPKF